LQDKPDSSHNVRRYSAGYGHGKWDVAKQYHLVIQNQRCWSSASEARGIWVCSRAKVIPWKVCHGKEDELGFGICRDAAVVAIGLHGETPPVDPDISRKDPKSESIN
jgi:hypothetical protein